MTALPFTSAIEPWPTSAWKVGTALPTESVAITTTLIVGGAIASRDFYAGHHDRDAAQAAGSPDVFMNIMTTAGIIGRYLTDVAGPQAAIVDLDLRLGAPNYPGDVMVIEGEVSAAAGSPEPGAGSSPSLLVDVTFRGTNARGTHAKGTARLDLAGSG